MLLGAPCYHMSEVLGRAGHVDKWIDAAAGRADWDAIFDGYAATVDFPAANYWRELSARYPDAKVILSVRDPDRWFESTQATIFSARLQAFQEGTRWGGMIKATIDDHLGGRMNDRAALTAAFNRHVEAVKAGVDPDRLLVFEAGQGWAPLCEFLDVPEPSEPYPRINSSEEFDNVFEMLGSPVGPRVMNGEGMEGGPSHRDLFEKE